MAKSLLPLALIALASPLAAAGATQIDPWQTLKTPAHGDPFPVAPTRKDWLAAFSRMRPEQQAAVRRVRLAFRASDAEASDTLYLLRMGFGHGGIDETTEVDKARRLDVATILDGFNDAFSDDARTTTWVVANVESYDGVEGLNGAVRFWFELDWQFEDVAGKPVNLSAVDSGRPRILGDPHALVAELDQSFASVFLQLVAQLPSRPRDREPSPKPAVAGPSMVAASGEFRLVPRS